MANSEMRMAACTRSLGVALLLAFIGLVAWRVVAQAASPFELNLWLSGPNYDAVVPLCGEAGPLKRSQEHFAEKESQYWVSDLKILGFENIREIAFRPWVPWLEGIIPRRYCTAIALVSDGVKRSVSYSIGEDEGFAGMGYGVDWCVVGLDRSWAYNPACVMARPGEPTSGVSTSRRP
jgi:hypothetical protein